MIVHGPSHPEMFRQQVGRYGDRFYVDNLPPDEICDPDSSVPMPSVSVVKSAFPKFLNKWVAGVTAQWAYEHRDSWTRLDRNAAVEVMTNAANRIKDSAADRGSRIHNLIEDLCFGRQPNDAMIIDSVRPYVQSAKRMVAELGLEPMYMECVVFNHDIEYGGTFDFIGKVHGHGVGLLDFKTREKYQAYEDEAAQVAAYAKAEYLIGEVGGNARRMPMPQLDFVAVVVITPNGYQVQEVDIENAWCLWVALTDFWRAKRLGVWKGLRAPLDIANPEELREMLRNRINAMPVELKQRLAASWPLDLPTLKQNPEPYQLLEIDRLVAKFADNRPFDYLDAEIDEAGTADPDAAALLLSLILNSDEHIRQAIEFHKARAVPGVEFTLRPPYNTIRRFEIHRALLALAERAAGNAALMANIADLEHLGEWTTEHAAQIADDKMWEDVGAASRPGGENE